MTCGLCNGAEWVSAGRCPSVTVTPGGAIFSSFASSCVPLAACQSDERYFLWVTALFSFVNPEPRRPYLKTSDTQCCRLLPRQVQPQNSPFSIIGLIQMKRTLLCIMLTVCWPSLGHHFQRVLRLLFCFFSVAWIKSHLQAVRDTHNQNILDTLSFYLAPNFWQLS